MKLKKVSLSVLLVALLVGSLLAPTARAALLIDFSDNNSNSASSASLSHNIVWYGSWSQTVASTNTSVSAIVRRNVEANGHAWLLNQIGPGTTGANVLAETDFLAPTITDTNYFDLSSAPYTTFFNGLNLSPGTYYLVLQGPEGPFVNQYDWLGDWISVGINEAPGFSLGSYAHTNSPDAFVPASNFILYTDNSKFFYRVEGVVAPVPEPAILALLCLGLAGLSFMRRKART